MNLAPPPPAQPNRPTLAPQLFNKFAELIYSLSGIRFEENKAYYLASKLQARCTALGLEDFGAYYDYLHSPTGRTEYGHLIDAITINETFFFRHQPQLEAFRDSVLMPMVHAKKQSGRSTLRIWSCAASTGDEIYTTVLMLKSLGVLEQMRVEFVGTDICHDALEKARAGIYRQYAIRNIPQDMLQRYFTHDTVNNTYQLSDEIKNYVRFQEANLMDGTRLRTLGKFDIAFCRNVLIYFDEPAKETVLQNISDCLEPEGVLLLGHSEDIYRQRHIFKADKDRQAAIAYQKAPPGTPRP